MRSPLLSRFVVAGLGAAAYASVAGCASPAPSQPPPRVLRIGIGAPPADRQAITGLRSLISTLKGEQWLASRPDGHVGERIALYGTWDETGTVLRLKLRPDVYFHDGTRLTSELAAEALRATDTRDNFSLQSVISFEPEGPDTVVLRLKEPNAFLLPDLAGIAVVKPGAPDIGTGPYQVVARNEQSAKLIAFPRYYRGRPALDGVEVTNYPTQRNAWTALMRGNIDMLYEVSRESVEFVQAERTVRVYPFSRPYYIPLVFNMRNPTLRNVEVRRAINEALDRSALVRDGLRGQGTEADGPVWPKHWAYSPPEHPFAFDPAAAKARLDRAGFPLKLSPERRVSMRLSFKCLVFGDDARFERLAVLAQKQLADIGIDMQLDAVPLDQLGRRIRAGDFDAFLIEFSGPRLSRVYEFWRSRPDAMNNTGYHAADAVLDRIRLARNDQETKAGVAELMRVMHDDPPAVFIAWQRSQRAVSTRFDVEAEPDRDILTSLWMWRPAAPQQQAVR